MSSGTSNPKLTSLTTSTLSLLLERQRLQLTHPTLHLQQIVSNLRTLRTGVIELQQASQGDDGGIEVLRGQFERLRGMLGDAEVEKAGLQRWAFGPGLTTCSVY
jgi:syntaxin 8